MCVKGSFHGRYYSGQNSGRILTWCQSTNVKIQTIINQDRFLLETGTE